MCNLPVALKHKSIVASGGDMLHLRAEAYSRKQNPKCFSQFFLMIIYFPLKLNPHRATSSLNLTAFENNTVMSDVMVQQKENLSFNAQHFLTNKMKLYLQSTYDKKMKPNGSQWNSTFPPNEEDRAEKESACSRPSGRCFSFRRNFSLLTCCKHNRKAH